MWVSGLPGREMGTFQDGVALLERALPSVGGHEDPDCPRPTTASHQITPLACPLLHIPSLAGDFPRAPEQAAQIYLASNTGLLNPFYIKNVIADCLASLRLVQP